MQSKLIIGVVEGVTNTDLILRRVAVSEADAPTHQALSQNQQSMLLRLDTLSIRQSTSQTPKIQVKRS